MFLVISRVPSFLHDGVVGNFPSMRKSYDLFLASALLAFLILVCIESDFVDVDEVFMVRSMVDAFFRLPEGLRELGWNDLDEAIVDAAVAFVLTLPGGDVGVFS